MLTGVVKMINVDRGFGFIRTDDGKELFFHRSDVGGGSGPDFENLEQGDKVRFNVVEGAPKGPRACGVEPAA